MNESEIQKIKDDIEVLKQADMVNAQQHKEILELLRPISNAYNTTTTIGKWVMALLTFISILLGVLLSWDKLR